jgi:hypothetical protein
MFLKSSIRKTNGRPVGKCGGTRAPSLEDVAASSPKIYSLYIMYTIAQTVIKTGTSLTRYGILKPTAPVRGNFSELATAPFRGLSLSR